MYMKDPTKLKPKPATLLAGSVPVDAWSSCILRDHKNGFREARS